MDAATYFRKRQPRNELFLCAVFLILLAFLPSCGHPKQARVDVPSPPDSTPEPASTVEPAAARPEGAARSDRLPSAESDADLAEPTIPEGSKPLATEIGRASWYGPPYHNRVGSNGEVYNMHAMTAAHRTLPLGSIVRVTNLKTGHVALVRITDRGPFIPGRVLDLSLAAARKLDVYLPGIAEVKVEVMQTPAPLEAGGRWAVQIGGFPHEKEARQAGRPSQAPLHHGEGAVLRQSRGRLVGAGEGARRRSRAGA